jgi:radical SAM protein with 4Fe4S-binding SPASM domain
LSRLKQASDILVDATRSTLHARSLTPESAIIFLTYRCTSRCTTCNIWQRPEEPERELTWEQWRPVMEQLASSSIKAVELFGGDALLRKDLLVEMIRFCAARDIQTYFPSNASALTRSTVEELVGAGLHTIYLSLDEVPEIEGKLRGVTRHFDRVMKAIEQIREARGSKSNPRIECITTVSSANWPHVPALLEFSRASGVDAHHIRGLTEFPDEAIRQSELHGIPPEPYFRTVEGESHLLSLADAQQFVAILDGIRRRVSEYAPMSVIFETLEGLSPEQLSGGQYLDHDCQFAASHVVLSPYGEVSPCLYFNKYVLGNLPQEQLKNVWGNDRHREFCRAQRSGQLPLCNFCSIKSVHLPLWATVRRHWQRVVFRTR